MSEITEKARYTGLDACDAALRTRESSPEFIHLMDRFIRDYLANPELSLEQVIENLKNVTGKGSSIFKEIEGREEK